MMEDTEKRVALMTNEFVRGHRNPYHRSAAEVVADLSIKGTLHRNPDLTSEDVLANVRLQMFYDLLKRRGRRYAECTFDTFEIDNSISKRASVNDLRLMSANLPELLLKGEAGLMLTGPPGTGKDHLLMSLMRDAILEHGYSIYWIDGLDFFNSIKRNNFADQDELIKACLEPQILAISDPLPPKDNLSTFDLAILRQIIERRYNGMGATWVTTNCQSADEANDLFTEAVLGRLLDGSKIIHCHWSSYRATR